MGVPVALVHDYLTQRGGAERVVLSMVRAFPDAPLYTSLYLPAATFPEFGRVDVRVLRLNNVGLLRKNHRLAFPFLATAFSQLEIDARVAICSSSGWAHGIRSTGRKIVYCHTPARWLYQGDRYLRGEGLAPRIVLKLLQKRLIRWDRGAASSADLYLTQSTAVRDRIRELYGREAKLLPAPHRLDPNGDKRTISGIRPGFFLCVSRLLPYKNVDCVVRAFASLPNRRLLVVGTGPDEHKLRRVAAANVTFLGQVSDSQLRWLYEQCESLICAAHEDYGLTPLEAAAFGKPTLALRWGGFVDTVAEGRTGLFFEQPQAEDVINAIVRLGQHRFRPAHLRKHAADYSEEQFIRTLTKIVEMESVVRTDCLAPAQQAAV